MATTKANDVLAGVQEEHEFTHTPANLNTTDGIKQALNMHWAAIQALADLMDGKEEPKHFTPKAQTAGARA